MDLLNTKCVPCEGGIPPLSEEKEDEFMKKVKGWQFIREGIHRIKKEFYFEDFKDLLDWDQIDDEDIFDAD